VVAAAAAMAATVAMAACSYCDAASTTATRSHEAAGAAWTVARAATKLDGATPEAADATTMVSRSMGSGLAMADRWDDLHFSSWASLKTSRWAAGQTQRSRWSRAGVEAEGINGADQRRVEAEVASRR
jgi:hypothetical protein